MHTRCVYGHKMYKKQSKLARLKSYDFGALAEKLFYYGIALWLTVEILDLVFKANGF